MVNSPKMCILCKGSRALCGQKRCPILSRFEIKLQIEKHISKEFFGPSYSVFVGRFGYPDVNIGPLVGLEQQPESKIDSPGE